MNSNGFDRAGKHPLENCSPGTGDVDLGFGRQIKSGDIDLGNRWCLSPCDCTVTPVEKALSEKNGVSRLKMSTHRTQESVAPYSPRGKFRTHAAACTDADEEQVKRI